MLQLGGPRDVSDRVRYLRRTVSVKEKGYASRQPKLTNRVRDEPWESSKRLHSRNRSGDRTGKGSTAPE